MKKFAHTASTVLSCLLAIGFALGTWGNLFVSAKAAASYERWGYPSWFHYLTAACELVAAVLLLIPRTRLYGAVIGIVVMGTAVVSIVAAGEAEHAIPAGVVLLVALIVAGLTLPSLRKRA